MRSDTVLCAGVPVPRYVLHTVVAGSGAAGLNAADCLWEKGIRDIAVVTENRMFGTSRNTGSDKQTFYKLSLSGTDGDSVGAVAQTLFEGGAMHGDTALADAALSAKNFYKLVSLGVPFPENEYGEYCGYKTDHDPRSRATSAGPLTSKFMTEKLEEAVRRKEIPVLEGFLVIGLLKAEDESCGGLAALNIKDLDTPHRGLTLFSAANTVYALGGPGDMYETSVYPPSQAGGTGIAMLAGAEGCNLPESQYGIASVGFRWNLSGSYQQVLPRYYSVGEDGRERDFLAPFFETPEKLLTAVFLKGYQWPFDPRKARGGSSLIDLLVYREREQGRKVYLDYRTDPAQALGPDGHFDPARLEPVVRDYLEKSGCLCDKPYDRLLAMNPPAAELYKSHGYDLGAVPIEIAVCAQHNNGGLAVDAWWESGIRNLFPVGEIAGTFGVYRPGGTALNATQTGGQRAAERIRTAYGRRKAPEPRKEEAERFLELCVRMTGPEGMDGEAFARFKREALRNMSAFGAHIRSARGAEEGLARARSLLKTIEEEGPVKNVFLLPAAMKLRNILLTQICYLGAIKEWIEAGGKSRGSYLIADARGAAPAPALEEFSFVTEEERARSVWTTRLIRDSEGYRTASQAEPVRPIPEPDRWFETVWADYRRRQGDLPAGG